IQGNFSRDGGTFGLEEAWVGYNFGNGVKLKMGQFKLPFLREELVSSKYQLAVDRSGTNEIFNQHYSQDIQLSYKAKNWRIMGAFSDGLASRNTDFNQGGGGLPTEADFAFTARAEFMFAGQWEDFEDFTSQPGQKFGALLGLAAHYEDSANSSNPTDVDL